MKICKQPIVALILLVSVLLMGVGPSLAQAATMGRLTLTPICFDKGQQVIKGSAFDVYCIGQMNDAGQLEPVEGLQGTEVDVSQWQSEKQAQNIATQVVKMQLPVTAHSQANADGAVVFENLKAGLYLVMQSNTMDGYSKALPFAVAVPMENPKTGEREYDVMAQPKVEPDTKPTPDVPTKPEKPVAPPSKPSQPTQKPSLGDLFQTGQLSWPIPILLIGGGVALVAGGYLVRSSKRKK